MRTIRFTDCNRCSNLKIDRSFQTLKNPYTEKSQYENGITGWKYQNSNKS